MTQVCYKNQGRQNHEAGTKEGADYPELVRVTESMHEPIS